MPLNFNNTSVEHVNFNQNPVSSVWMENTEVFKDYGLSNATAYGKMEQRNLPQGYTQAEYLRQTYSAAAHAMRQKHFDTGYVPVGDEVIEWSMKIISIGTTGFIIPFGCRVGAVGTSATNYWFGVDSNSAVYCRFGTVNPSVSLTMTTGTLYKCKIDIPNGVLTINGTDYAMTGTSVSGITDSIWLMTLNQHEQSETVNISCDGSFDLIDFKISRNGTEVYHAYPTTTPGVFDTVSGTENTTIGGSYGTITAGSAATPTPDNPQDLWCNNGRLVAKNPSGIPLAYEELEYIESSGTQYIDTGLTGNGNTKVRLEYYYPSSSSVSGSGRIFGSRDTVKSRAFNTGTMTGTTDTRILFGGFDGQDIKTNARETPLQTWFAVEVSVNGFFIDGVQVGDAWTAETFTTPENLKLFGFDSAGSMGYGIGRCRRYKRWDDTVLTQDLIPARRRSDNEVGMYDLVSGDFLTNAGTGTFTAGNAVAPIVEAEKEVGKNKYNEATAIDGYYIATDGTIIANSISRYSQLMPVGAGVNIVLSGKQEDSSYRNAGKRIHAYDANGTWIQQIASAAVTGIATYTATGTTPANCAYVRISFHQTDTNVQLELGSTATPYEPYREGEVLTVTDGTNTYTATVSDLLAVGDYKDTHELISGLRTHNVGYKVFDGTESDAYWLVGWVAGAYTYTGVSSGSAVASRSRRVVCTHGWSSDTLPSTTTREGCVCLDSSGNMAFCFANTYTFAEFKALLADQYAAGTPVILLYPLATSTTEQLTAQPLDTARGDNVVESENSVPQVSATITYKKR